MHPPRTAGAVQLREVPPLDRAIGVRGCGPSSVSGPDERSRHDSRTSYPSCSEQLAATEIEVGRLRSRLNVSVSYVVIAISFLLLEELIAT